MSVLLAGVPSEPPVRMVAEALEQLEGSYVLFNQRCFAQAHIAFALRDGVLRGVLELGAVRYNLENFGGVYTRVMDHEFLPELKNCPPEHPLREHANRLHATFNRWCEIAPARVINRPSANGSNSSKPFQAQMIRRYFRIPRTLLTNDPDEVLAFGTEHRRIVYKSISGERSIVHEFTEADHARLADLRSCPVQFQEFIPGTDVRVHTVASGDVFATAVVSDAVDYRYAHRTAGHEARLTPYRLSDDVAAACLSLAAELELDFAGLDLRVTPDGEVYCLEVNPSPAFSYYEVATGQAIAMAVACYLVAGGSTYT